MKGNSPRHKTVHILAVVLGLIWFAGWGLNTIPVERSFHSTDRVSVIEYLDAEGHAIEEHVGKSDAYLRHRLQTERISAASTFNDMAEADNAVRMVLARRQALIATWLQTEKSNKKAFYYQMENPVGRVLKREWDVPRRGNQVRVVLIRDTDYAEGFYILTAYPEIRE